MLGFHVVGFFNISTSRGRASEILLPALRCVSAPCRVTFRLDMIPVDLWEKRSSECGLKGPLSGFAIAVNVTRIGLRSQPSLM